MEITSIIERLEFEREKIWLDEPEEMFSLRARKGARDQNLSVLIYATADTDIFVEILSQTRILARDRHVDLKTLVSLTNRIMKFYGSRYERYYSLYILSKLVKDAAEALPKAGNEADFLALVEAVMYYVGRMNYWIDIAIPWDQITKGI